jgi:HEAT repeat protein
MNAQPLASVSVSVESVDAAPSDTALHGKPKDTKDTKDVNDTMVKMGASMPLETDAPLASLTAVLDALRTGDFQTRWEAAKAIPLFGEAAIEPLLELLQPASAVDQGDDENEWELLWFVARTLGRFNHPVAINALIEILLSTNDAEIVGMAATTLATIGRAAVPPLTELLTRPSSRLIAVQALAQVQHPSVVPPLFSVVDDQDPEVRAAAVEAISHFHSPAIMAVLVSALRDPIVKVRRAAVIALGVQADQTASADLVEHLSPLLWDLNPEVCRQAAIALGRIGTKAAIQVLDRVLQSVHTPIDLQIEVVRALAWIGSAMALEPLRHYLLQTAQLQTPSSTRQSTALEQEMIAVLGRVESAEARQVAVQILLDLLRSRHPSAQTSRGKQQIALSLGQLQDASAIDALISLLSDSDSSVQLHAIAGLKQLAAHGAYERLQVLLTTGAITAELKTGITMALQEWQIHAELA